MIASPGLDELRKDQCIWVLSEAHSSASPLTFFSRVIPAEDAWIEKAADFLKSRLHGFDILKICHRRSNKTAYHASHRYFGEFELDSPAGDETDSISISSIKVRTDGKKRSILVNSLTGNPIALLPPVSPRDAGVFAHFRMPRCFTKQLSPSTRMTEKSIVTRRASWVISGKDAPAHSFTWFQAFVWCQRLRRQNQMPRWLFIKAARERKPVFLDFFNPFLCEEFIRKLRTNDQVYAEEMYPTPDHIWLRHETGRYLCEFRFLYASRLKPDVSEAI
jgi:hypothetical protein